MATKKAPAKKAAKKEKKAPAKKAAAEKKGPTLISQIIALHKKGKTNKEIIEAGFNKNTVGIQVAKYKREPESFDKK